MQYLLSIYVNN